MLPSTEDRGQTDRVITNAADLANLYLTLTLTYDLDF